MLEPGKGLRMCFSGANGVEKILALKKDFSFILIFVRKISSIQRISTPGGVVASLQYI